MPHTPRLAPRTIFRLFRGGWLAVAALAALVGAARGETPFRMQEIDASLGVGYAVRLIDMNGDGKRDIVVVDTRRLVWYENPTWKAHSFLQDQTKPDNVCFSPLDIDGDGKLDFAVGADWKPFNTQSGGTLQWIRRTGAGLDAWAVHPIDEVPTIHRIQWHDIDHDGKPELIVVPLMGRNSTKETNYSDVPLHVVAYRVPADPVRDRWPAEILCADVHVSHNFAFADLNRDGKTEILLASFEGVSVLVRNAAGKWERTRIGAGNQETKPNRGASEIKYGRLRKDGDYIATIEPWHGHQVVAYTRPPAGETLWTRRVLDEQLKWGHAVWPANLDDDEDEELIIGVRDDLDATWKSGVRLYDPQDAAAGKWTRQLVDAGGVAVEDLAAEDLNGDGRVDIVAVGRKTKNVRIYWNERR